MNAMMENAEVSDDFFNWSDIDLYDHTIDAARAFTLRHPSVTWTPEELTADYEDRA